jgi:predicted N-formylglutamate amidohydrolase
MDAGTATGKASSAQVVDVDNPDGGGRFILVCEHASNFIPPEFGTLGLSGDALQSHIAWDPGALAVARLMSGLLDAPLVAQRLSRLVYDCNRPPQADSAVPAHSEIHLIPGNTGLSAAERQVRVELCYQPFRKALDDLIEARMGGRHLPVLLTVHSFTPVYRGVARDLEIGILHDADARFADTLIEVAAAETSYEIRRNAPYGPEDGVTHTLAEHALPRGLLNAMIEIRNDLIGDEPGQRRMAADLARCAELALGLVENGTSGRRPASVPDDRPAN